MTKTCMFQFATSRKILCDTDLITKEEALALFEKNKDDFIILLADGQESEMGIWKDCKSNTSYEQTLIHWWADDMRYIDGALFQRV